ncbi:hypothetical protein SS50377_22623 [Spironucleus salmonicida]|uniref:Uncharacterized protein n=1 Tax=Spironucleus salmonicida TaxID=348837 RepID=V6LST4_9EUKA|nr:hypothetical protein SS50377_22623 [Spironucleus salmonicida]|eukprot:EST47313.1 Hypothetical protein SS50377_12631 [Spironucleus salmonicida]
MNENAIMTYAFNMDTKFIASIQKVRTLENTLESKNYTCNYPQVVFPLQEVQIQHQTSRQKSQDTYIKRQKTQQVHELMELKQFAALSDKEILSVEKAAQKLSSIRQLYSTSSIRRNTSSSTILKSPQRKQSSKLNLLDLQVITRK